MRSLKPVSQSVHAVRATDFQVKVATVQVEDRKTTAENAKSLESWLASRGMNPRGYLTK